MRLKEEKTGFSEKEALLLKLVIKRYFKMRANRRIRVIKKLILMKR